VVPCPAPAEPAQLAPPATGGPGAGAEAGREKRPRSSRVAVLGVGPLAHGADAAATEACTDASRLVLLDPAKFAGTAAEARANDAVRAQLERAGVREVADVTIEFGYEELSTEEALRVLLPAGVEPPSAFETVGHIAHLNLRPEHEPFKRRIGQVILDKCANVKTVVNKVGVVENRFRTLPMDILVGDPSTRVVAHTHGLAFRFDFAKVYWNSRLSEEHNRLVADRFRPGDVVLDAFCGVGPFAVRAAKRGCRVLASDLNPDSHAALVENLRGNKVPLANGAGRDAADAADAAQRVPAPGSVAAFNMDARAFLRLALGSPALPWGGGAQPPDHHVVMNLPADAPEFLDSLVGCFPPATRGAWAARARLPLIHCYCFTSGDSDAARHADVAARVARALGGAAPAQLEVRLVRDVAPRKLMVCAHFELPRVAALGRSLESGAEPDAKRARREEGDGGDA